MIHHGEGAAGTGGAPRGGVGGAGAGRGVLSQQETDHLTKITDLALRQLKKLRKSELEQVRR